MTFEEKEYIKIPNTQDTFVYFLLDGLEVVYVGKTINNLSRPLSHRDKKYDSINLIYCPKEKLVETEDFFIQKYKPKYNLVVNGAYNFSLLKARNKLRQQFAFDSLTIWDLKKIIKELSINTFLFNQKVYISLTDYKKVAKYLKEECEIEPLWE